MVRNHICSSGWVVLAVLIVGGAQVSNVPAAEVKRPGKPEAEQRTPEAKVRASFARLPIAFEPNRGQAGDSVRFIGRTPQATVLVGDTETTVLLRRADRTPAKLRGRASASRVPSESAAVRMHVVGARRPARIVGREPLPGISNYFHGNNPKKWVTDVPQYGKIEAQGVLPGVDLVLYGGRDHLEYDFVLSPGANPDSIHLAFDGADSLDADAAGNLRLGTSVGTLIQRAPKVYQEAGGKRQEIAAAFRIEPAGTIAFALGEYDRHRSLVIDPIFDFSTIFGSSGFDAGYQIAVDGQGNSYITGWSAAGDFPLVNPLSGAISGVRDAIVAKLNSTGSALLYSTYLGGSADELGYGIALDASGNAYVCGYTTSTDFPTVAAAQPTHAGMSAGFVAKLNATGNVLLFSTYLSGSGFDVALAIAVEKNTGIAHVTGTTGSVDFPVTAGALQPSGLPLSAFVTRFNASGVRIYSTYLGGTIGSTNGTGIGTDSAGNSYITGATSDATFPVTSNAPQKIIGGGSDAFVSKLNAAGSSLLYSTFLGGSGADGATGIAVHSSGSVAISGTTASSDLLVTAGAAQTSLPGTQSAFAARLNASGSAFSVVTYLGGRKMDSGLGVAVDEPAGNVYVVGQTYSDNFPSINALQPTKKGTSSVVQKSVDGGQTWVGTDSGINDIYAYAIRVHAVTPSILLLATSSYVSRSTDGGNTWVSVLHLNSCGPPFLAASPVNPDLFYAGCGLWKVWKTSDAGQHWLSVSTSTDYTQVRCFATHPGNVNILYAATSAGVAKSVNGGVTWSYVNSGLTSLDVRSLAVDPFNGEVLYVSTPAGVFKTTNGGDLWQLPGGASGSATMSSLVLDPASPSTLYALDYSSPNLYKSTDSGLTWNLKYAFSGNAGFLSVAPTSPTTIFVSGGAYENGAILKSTDGGTSFSQLAGDFTVADLVVHPTNANILFAASNLYARQDGFVTKLDPTGTTILYSTFLGSPGGGAAIDEAVRGVATDSSGNAYVTGYLNSIGFPLTQGKQNNAFALFVSEIIDSNPPCAVSFNPATPLVYASGAQLSIGIIAPSGCSWLATPGVPWITVGVPNSGMAAGSVSVTVAANPGVERTGTISFGVQSFAVTQAANGCFYQPEFNAEVPSIGGVLSIQLATGAACRWQASSNNPSFVTVNAPAQGTGPSQILFTVAPNPSLTPRYGSVNIGQALATFRQMGQCIFSLSATSATVQTGGTGTVWLTTNLSQCPWSVGSASPDWLTVTSPSYGTGSTTVSWSAAPNTTGAARTGYLQIADQLFTVNQAAAPALPTSPSPSDGATGVALSPALTWIVDAGASSYDVFFGTAPSPPLVGNVTFPAYIPVALTGGTQYYWQIVAKNGGGTASSPVWSFQTASSSAIQLVSVVPGASAGNSGQVPMLAVGRNFAPGASVKWTTPGGVTTTLPADFISSAQLQATIPPSLFTTSGTAQVSIQNPDTSVTGSQPFVISPSGQVYGVSLTPNWGTGSNQPFQLRVSDAAGVADLVRIRLHVTPSAGPFGGAPVSSCLVDYTSASNQVGLLDDAGVTTNYLTPGVPGTLQNSQCSIDMSAVSVSASGNDLLFAFPLLFKSGFTGLMQMAAAVDGTVNSSPFQVLGNWMPVAPTFVRRYTFSFTPTVNVPFAATWSYTSIAATPPGSATLPVLVNPLALPKSSGVRNADGSWSFNLNDGMGPHVAYGFVAKTDLSFANSPGIYPAVPAQLSFCTTCPGVPNSGSGSGMVDITIADVATPQLSSLQPTTAMVDSGPAGMTVNGSNFASGAAIQWTFGGTTSTLPADFLTSVQLQTTLPASFLTTAGTAQVAAMNPAGATSGVLPFTIFYPTPVLNSLNPNTAPAQSGPTRVTANGTGFFNGATMQWTAPGGGTLSLPTTFINSLQLQATIPSSFLSTPGTAQVAIQNPGNLLSGLRQFLISSAPALAIAKTHAGNFTQGQEANAYTVTVSNQGTAPTGGTVTVTETAPVGLTVISMAGSGWTCGTATTCTRGSVLNPGASYPAITVMVNVAPNAGAMVINQVSVSGGGSAPATVGDPTVVAAPSQYLISTIAGGIAPPTAGAATGIPIGTPNRIVATPGGNVYFTNSSWHSVFKLDGNGVLTRVAGTGRPGFSGDGGPAVNAQLNGPQGLAVDSAGNLYIVDGGNSRIRKVDLNGTISTVAGNGGWYSPQGVACDSAGNLYVAEYARVRKITPGGIISTVAGNGTLGFSGDGGAATAAMLSYVTAVAVDKGGNLYIADLFNYRVRVVTPGGTINTFAGTGTYGYSGDNGPATSAMLGSFQGIAVDSAGNVYIADSSNSRIRKVTPGGMITTVAGNGWFAFSGDNGPATSAALALPTDVAADGAGNIYVADANHFRIRKVTGGTISTIAGNGNAFSGEGGAASLSLMTYPQYGATDAAGNFYFADQFNHRVRKIAPDGTIVTVAGNGSTTISGDGRLATAAGLPNPAGVAVDASGNLYIGNSCSVRMVTPGGTISTVAGTGTCGFSGDNGPATSAQITPEGLAVDSAGNLYIADPSNERVRKVTKADGVITTVAGTGNYGFSGDNGQGTSAQLNGPGGVALDAAGNLYIADRGNSRVRMLAKNGIITTFAGTGTYGHTGDGGPATSAQVGSPYGLAFDGVGNLLIASGAAIRRVLTNGIIITVAGTGSNGYSGDGGPAVLAQISNPIGVALDSLGRIYLVDNAANAIRALTPAGTRPVLAVANTHSGNFTQGQSGATSTVMVSNATGAGPTSGTVTVTDVLPAALTLASMSGSNWSCNGNTCTRSDTLAAGASYPPITVTVNVAANALPQVTNQITVSGGGSLSTGTSDLTLVGPAPLRFVPITPCRIADTRSSAGPFGGPAISGGTSRDFTIPNSACGLPSTAQAYSLNVAVVPPGMLGYLTLWPTGRTRPVASTLNSLDGRIKSNAAIVPAGTGGAVSVFASDTTNVILDINGYFVPATDPNGLAFYPIAPCRITDTRSATAPLGGPSLGGGTSRTFPILSGACGIPVTAQAYSMNLAAVPGGHPLGYVTAWPTGQAKPAVASLNALTGTVVANAAIVKAGTNGSIDIFASDATNLVIDINGYFAPMGTGGLSLYGVTPCRVVDTRKPAGSPALASLNVGVSASACEIPANAQAHVLSVTVVPQGSLGYLTLWQQGQTRPVVSTLNALDGAITSNLAIVPTGNGSISAFGSDMTHLILDISGYFGQ